MRGGPYFGLLMWPVIQISKQVMLYSNFLFFFFQIEVFKYLDFSGIYFIFIFKAVY